MLQEQFCQRTTPVNPMPILFYNTKVQFRLCELELGRHIFVWYKSVTAFCFVWSLKMGQSEFSLWGSLFWELKRSDIGAINYVLFYKTLLFSILLRYYSSRVVFACFDWSGRRGVSALLYDFDIRWRWKLVRLKVFF